VLYLAETDKMERLRMALLVKNLQGDARVTEQKLRHVAE